MLVKLFKSNQHSIIIFVLLVTIILWLPSFYSISNVFNSQRATILFLNHLFSITWFNSVFSILLVFIQAIYLNHIVNKYKIVKNNTHLIALIFVLLNGANSFITTINPVLFVNIIVIVILHQLLAIYNKNEAFSLSFNAGLLVGLGSLIYFPVVVLFPTVWIVLFYTKTVLWRELVISILGVFLPFTYLLMYYFFKNQLNILDMSIFSSSYFNTDFNKWIFNDWLYFMVFALVLILSIFYLVSSLNKNVVEIRKHTIIILLILVIYSSTLFINQFDYLSTYLLMTVPVAVIIANYINEIKRKWLAELIMLSIVAAIIVNYFS